MLSDQDKQIISDIDKQIQELQEKKKKINPYSVLKSYSNKMFGEQWSEPHILKYCPSFERINGKGYDFYNPKLGKVEVKSCRLPATTVNQCHPQDCDYFLFVFYDCENYEDYLYLVPSNIFIKEFSPSVQHDRKLDDPSCYNVNLGTKNRLKKLQEYKTSYEELNKLL